MTEKNRLVPEQQPLGLFWGSVVKYGLATAVLIFYFTVVLHFSYTPDDTYIYLQYAKNLAHNDGFSFNAGTPSYGVAGPLWVLLIAAGAKIGLDPYIVAKTFDLFFASLSIVLVQLLAFAVMRDKVFAFFGAWLFSFDAWFLRWSGSGGETSLAVFLTLLAIWYAFQREYYLSAFVVGLLTLVRPESILLFLVTQIDNVVDLRQHRVSLVYFFRSVAVYAAIVIPWLVFSYVYFGVVLPNTFAAKLGGNRIWADVVRGAVDMLQVFFSTQAISLLLLVVSVVFILSKVGISIVWEVAFPVFWILVLPLSYLAKDVQVVSRYLLPVVPLIIIYALWGLKHVAEEKGVPYRRAIQVLSVVAAFALVQNVFVYRMYVVPHVVNFSAGISNCLRPIAYWLRNNTRPNATVISPDVGLIGYVSEKRMYDPAGLVSPEVRQAFNGASYDEGMVQKRYEKILRPDYVVDRSSTKERLLSDSLRPIMTAEFPQLGIRKPDPMFYTLYKVKK